MALKSTLKRKILSSIKETELFGLILENQYHCDLWYPKEEISWFLFSQWGLLLLDCCRQINLDICGCSLSCWSGVWGGDVLSKMSLDTRSLPCKDEYSPSPCMATIDLDPFFIHRSWAKQISTVLPFSGKPTALIPIHILVHTYFDFPHHQCVSLRC